jgi:hypothetical protein
VLAEAPEMDSVAVTVQNPTVVLDVYVADTVALPEAPVLPLVGVIVPQAVPPEVVNVTVSLSAEPV